MSEGTFFLRCAVCKRELHVEWGPETHSEAQRKLIEHVGEHSDAEIREWAMPILVGRVARPPDVWPPAEKARP